MIKKITVKEVNDILSTRTKGVRKPLLFGEDIEKLKVGEGIVIEDKDWTMKTPPSSYYYHRLRKKEELKVSVVKIDNGHLVIRI
jgi:hypothetical protein